MSSLITVNGTQIRIQGKLLRTAKVEAEGYLFLEDPESVIQQLRKCGERIDLFTFVPRLPAPAAPLNYPAEPHNFAALPVTTFDHWWNDTLGFKGRNKAKQAEKKGVTVREVPFDDTLVKGIWEVYNESPIRQGEPNSHYGKSLEQVHKMEATFLDNSVFIGAFFEGNLIGFIKMVWDDTRTQAGLMNIVSMIKHRDKAPTNALVVQAVRSCAERKIPYLVYASFAYGKKRTSSLSDFKERNGFQQVDVPRYYVPLTAAGRLAYKMGLHRKLADHLPESVNEKLRNLRTAWYTRKFQSASETA